MDRVYRDALVSGVRHVLSLLDFVPDGVVVTDRAASANGAVAQLAVRGDLNGVLSAGVSGHLAARLCGQLGAPVAPEQTELLGDGVCEFLNMVAESTRTLLGQQQIRTSIDAPEVVSTQFGGTSDSAAFVSLTVDGEPLAFWFQRGE